MLASTSGAVSTGLVGNVSVTSFDGCGAGSAGAGSAGGSSGVVSGGFLHEFVSATEATSVPINMAEWNLRIFETS
jgi:hypothetical protein